MNVGAPGAKFNHTQWLQSLSRLIVRLGRLLRRLTEWALVAIIGAQFVALFLQVFTRYVMNHPIAWGEEVALHLMVWMMFLGAAYGIRKADHPRLSVLATLEEAHPSLRLLQVLVVIFFVGGLGISGAVLAYVNRTNLSPNAEISQSYLYLAVPVGAILILVELLMRKLDPPPDEGSQPTETVQSIDRAT